MKLRARLRLASFLVLLAPLVSRAASPPNVIIFYADDLGWGEIAAQGFSKDIPTPNLTDMNLLPPGRNATKPTRDVF